MVQMELSKQLVIGEVLTRWAKIMPDAEAIVFKDRRVTYGEFNQRVNRLANALQAMGVQKGDKISVLFINSIEMVECYVATCKVGAVVVALNFRLVGREISYQVDQSDSKFFIYDRMFQETLDSIADQLPKVQHYICSGPNKKDETRSNKTHDYVKLLTESSSEEPDILVSDDDPVFILYTSGTTGKPKGAVLTHKNVVMEIVNFTIDAELRRGDRSVVTGPMFHVAGMLQFFVFLFLGGTSIVIDQFDPENLLKLIETEKATVAQIIPSMWIILLTLPNIGDYDTSTLRSTIAGAAVLPVEVMEQALKQFPGLEIYNLFGQTETTGAMTMLHPRDSFRKKGSVGKRMINSQARIVDDQDKDVPIGEVGEIIYKGPTVLKEYYNNHEATAEAMKGGWFHSGDLVREDEEGYIYVVDRKKDMIISGGENIYPAEIEEVLFANSKVLEVAVIGVPDPRWGESVKAIVVPKKGESLNEEEIIEHCKKYLASYKKPKIVEISKALPRNAAGKVLKYELRRQFS
jgi:fatty-acyl-CoA synthase